MKKSITLLTLICLLVLQQKSYSQIDEGFSLYNIGCASEDSCDVIQFDTSSTNIWQLGNTTKPFFAPLYAPPNAIITDTLNPYPVNNHSSFEIRLTQDYLFLWSNTIINFYHKYQMDSLTEAGYIDASYDNGITWHDLYDNSADPADLFFSENLYPGSIILPVGVKGFTGTQHQWIQTRLQWIWSLPRNFPMDTFIVRFNFISDSVETNKAGWIIDSLYFQGAYLGSGINEISMDNNPFVILENPAANEIQFNTVKNPDYFITQLRIFDEVGQLKKDYEGFNRSHATIAVVDLAKGIYFYQIKTKGAGYFSGKFLIQ